MRRAASSFPRHTLPPGLSQAARFVLLCRRIDGKEERARACLESGTRTQQTCSKNHSHCSLLYAAVFKMPKIWLILSESHCSGKKNIFKVCINRSVYNLIMQTNIQPQVMKREKHVCNACLLIPRFCSLVNECFHWSPIGDVCR